MNIREAKNQIKQSIDIYLAKDNLGNYKIPIEKQRPIFLLGAPGIGKTAIMEQIADELGIAIVSYSMTHHTRQSALGLPFIVKKNYDGVEYSVSEYTMSEIIASVYETRESTGKLEGILFLDEINCVSETLAPSMLQFLQCKTFGSHQIPKGWLIVAAGNPPEYNKSVREFDVVTMVRVKKILVEPDLEAWKEYAYQAGVHGAVLSYLNMHPENFYSMESTVDGRVFATPRGWEDLSRMLQVYERLDKSFDREVVIQYIQHPRIARDFANYLELYYKYRTDYQIDRVLDGQIDDILVKKAAHASFDERLSVTGLLLSKLNLAFDETVEQEKGLEILFELLKGAKSALTGPSADQPMIYLEDMGKSFEMDYAMKKKAGFFTREEDYRYRKAGETLEKWLGLIRSEDNGDGVQVFERLKALFQEKQDEYHNSFEQTSLKLEYAFDFMEAVFPGGQELVVFISELNRSENGVRFLREYSCERYFRYNKELLFRENTKDILHRIQELGE